MTLTGKSGKLELKDPAKNPESVLFVCLGNVIRSPLCEGLFRKATNGTISVDSAALLSSNINEQPAANAQKVAKMHGFDISQHRARRVTKKDFASFDLIVSLEPHVKRKLDQMKPNPCRARVVDFIPSTKVSNPWGLPLRHFIEMYTQIEKGMESFLATNFPGIEVQMPSS